MRAVAQALLIVGRQNALPDLDLLVSNSNQERSAVEAPIFTRHRPRRRSGYLLLPMEWQLSPGQSRKQSIGAMRRGSQVQRRGLVVSRPLVPLVLSILSLSSLVNLDLQNHRNSCLLRKPALLS